MCVEKPLSTNVLLLSHSHQTLIAYSKPIVFPCGAWMYPWSWIWCCPNRRTQLSIVHAPSNFCLTPPPDYQSPSSLLVRAESNVYLRNLIIFIICSSAPPYIVVVSAREAALVIKTAITRQLFGSSLV